MSTGVFHEFECCEGFVLSIRAMYALTMVLICAKNSWRHMNLKRFETIWDKLKGFAWAIATS